MVFLVVIGLFAFNNDAEAQTKENPIKFEELGFPRRGGMCGTGAPKRLDRKSAVAIIDSVFSANDIKLQKDYGFSQGDVSFKTGGYDPESRIGYVWLDGTNTTSDSYNSYQNSYEETELLSEDQAAYNKIKENNKNYQEQAQFFKTLEQKGYYKLLSLKKHYPNRRNEELQKEVDEYLEKNPNKSDVNYGEEIYEKYAKDPLDLKEIQAITEAEDYDIGAFSRYSGYLSYYWGYRDISQEKNEEISGKEKALQNLATFVQEYIDWAKSEGRF